MNDLIEALKIIAKYNLNASTHCEHDILSICGVEPEEVSNEDIILLDKYGFFVGSECGEEAFESYRWGSC